MSELLGHKYETEYFKAQIVGEIDEYYVGWCIRKSDNKITSCLWSKKDGVNRASLFGSALQDTLPIGETK